MQFTTFLRVSLHSLIHVSIDASGVFLIECVSLRCWIFGTGRVEEAFQLLETLHDTIKLIELGTTIEDVLHFSLYLFKNFL